MSQRRREESGKVRDLVGRQMFGKLFSMLLVPRLPGIFTVQSSALACRSKRLKSTAVQQ